MKRSSSKKEKEKEQEGERRIAVVEEVADAIYSIKFVLQSLGYKVRSVAPNNWKSILEEFSPELIIVDMMIPQGRGHEVIQAVRQGPFKKVPILAITAEAMEGTEEEVYEAGAQEAISKPYSVQELQKKLKKLLK